MSVLARWCLVLIAALAVVGLAAVPASASECSYPITAYGTGGDPVAGGPVNDPLFPRQWGLEQINAPEAWAQGALGEGAVVAHLDSGVDLTHPDLSGSLLPGVDFYAEITGAIDCPGPQDEAGHGTFTASLIAAGTDNGIGVAGVAPRAEILPLRVGPFTTAGPHPEAVSTAIRFAADRGADVINMSFYVTQGTPEDNLGTSDFARAVDYAWEKGAVLVSIAGNDARPLCGFPARHPRVICVAATDRSGQPSTFSNAPVKPEGLALRAPGGGRPSRPDLGLGCEEAENIWGAIWPGSIADCGPSINGYDTGAGTSWAGAHVSGVAALLAAKGLANTSIIDCLQRTSSNGGMYDPVLGYGIVDAATAVADCDPVADLSLTQSDSRDPGRTARRLNYRVTVTNNGPDTASGIRIEDRLPPRVRFVSATSRQGSCVRVRRTVTCSVEALDAGTQASANVVVKPRSPGTITNHASVTGTTSDLSLGNDSASEKTRVCRRKAGSGSKGRRRCGSRHATASSA